MLLISNFNNENIKISTNLYTDTFRMTIMISSTGKIEIHRFYWVIPNITMIFNCIQLKWSSFSSLLKIEIKNKWDDVINKNVKTHTHTHYRNELRNRTDHLFIIMKWFKWMIGFQCFSVYNVMPNIFLLMSYFHCLSVCLFVFYDKHIFVCSCCCCCGEDTLN